MKLLVTPTSPYARKARVTARERSVDLEEVFVNPHADDAELIRVHPLGKVPALVTSLGTLHDSRVVVRYLAAQGEGPELVLSGDEGWRDLALEATADGILDSAVAIVLERRRPEHLRSPDVVDRQLHKISRALGELPSSLQLSLTIGRLSLACALGYLSFRIPEMLWRENRADLGDWYAEQARRPSMIETMPPTDH